MAMPSIQKQILEELSKLRAEEQRQVLDFARGLVRARLRGISGKLLLELAGEIDAEDLKRMADAIEEGCERVDLGEW